MARFLIASRRRGKSRTRVTSEGEFQYVTALSWKSQCAAHEAKFTAFRIKWVVRDSLFNCLHFQENLKVHDYMGRVSLPYLLKDYAYRSTEPALFGQ